MMTRYQFPKKAGKAQILAATHPCPRQQIRTDMGIELKILI
jgi:hypothetical protein